MDTHAGQARRDERDAGFTLMEQIVSMTVLFAVLLGLLVALGAGARGIANGRQRTIATSLAKQQIEYLQGSAYTAIAMNLSSPGLSTDPNVTGTAPNQKFEGEFLVGGSTTPYTSVVTDGGGTFTVKTYVTAVAPTSGSAYRRITVLVDWTPSTSGSAHSMRFSSLVYPLDYTSYPAGAGSAEVAGASVTISGLPAFLAGETFDDFHLNLPQARAETSASTLRTAHGVSSSSTGVVDVGAGPLTSTTCQLSGTSSDIAECALVTFDNIADNDAGSQAADVSETVAAPFVARTVSTPGGLTLTTPAGTTTNRVSTDECVACTFGDADALPWSQAAVATTTGASAASSTSGSTLAGALWSMGPGWSASATSDHDGASGGLVTSTAQLQAPAVDVLRIDGVPGFTAAVKVPALSASVTTYSGHTSSTPSVSSSAEVNVQIWNGIEYLTYPVTPGEAFDSGPVATSAPIVVGDHAVSFTSQVVAQPSTTSSAGTTVKTESAAQYPSLLVVTVDVTVTSLSTASQTAAFTITFDYGRTTSLSTWVQQ